MTMHYTGRPYQCTVCPMSFTRKRYLTVHSKQHQVPPFKCNLCSKLFRRRDHLKGHLARIHGMQLTLSTAELKAVAQVDNLLDTPTWMQSRDLVSSPGGVIQPGGFLRLPIPPVSGTSDVPMTASCKDTNGVSTKP